MNLRRDIWKARALKLWREWGRPLLLVVLVFSTFRSAIADWNDVPTGSMKPTILEGDRILVNKLAYDLKVPFTTWHLLEWAEPQHGEIVVCFSPADGTRLVKRVVGIPGDRIAMHDNRLIINGASLEYGRLDAEMIQAIPADRRGDHRFASEQLGNHRHPVMITPRVVAPRSFGPLTVPDGHYFLMGDNRDVSGDSRLFGFVPRDQIVGRTGTVGLSVDPARYYLPRWGRFLRKLP